MNPILKQNKLELTAERDVAANKQDYFMGPVASNMRSHVEKEFGKNSTEYNYLCSVLTNLESGYDQIIRAYNELSDLAGWKPTMSLDNWRKTRRYFPSIPKNLEEQGLELESPIFLYEGDIWIEIDGGIFRTMIFNEEVNYRSLDEIEAYVWTQLVKND